MYEKPYLEALIKKDHVRIKAIERLNSDNYYYRNSSDRIRDELTAVWGSAYDSRCKS